MSDSSKLATTTPTPSAPDAKPQPQAWPKLIDNPWLIVAMLFLVTAVCGLPFLWMSRGFSTAWKIVLTIAVLLWTGLVFWAFWLVMAWCVPRIWEALNEIFH
jgi:hypothetical protein